LLALKAESCWKEADLRGAYPAEISTELFERIGGALGTRLGPQARVMIAGDFRLSTPSLKDALARGLLATGAQVLDAGQIPTPVAYFAANRHEQDALLIVTASHNPPGDNGLKLLLGGRPPSAADMSALRELSGRGEFRIGLGSLMPIRPLPAYERFMIERWRHIDPEFLPELVVDAGNGAWSEIAPRVLSALNFKVRCLSCQIDGSFPDRPSDCSRPANLRRLRELVGSLDHAVGIAWDGDGDRVAAVDGEGNAVSADALSILMARELFLPRGFGEARPASDAVVIDGKLASVVQREVERLGGEALLERTGHAFMRTRMIATGARLGLDACGHFFFGELHGADDGLFAAMTLLDCLQRSPLPLKELVKALPPSYGSPELRIPLELISFAKAAAALLDGFPEAKVGRMDGIRLALPNGIVLLRESGTEAKLSLRIEGVTADSYAQILERSMSLLPDAEATIQAQLQEHREG